MADAETGGEPAPAKQRRSCCGAIGRALWLVLCCVPRLVFWDDQERNESAMHDPDNQAL